MRAQTQMIVGTCLHEPVNALRTPAGYPTEIYVLSIDGTDGDVHQVSLVPYIRNLSKCQHGSVKFC